jgi:urea-proton symporter
MKPPFQIQRLDGADTWDQVVRARYGSLVHIVFLVFALVTNILVSLMLILGGSATVHALTGMHTLAAVYLLPLGVVAYTLVGGLKATILTDWIHTFILLIIIIIFSLTAYASSDTLGSPSAVYDLLVQAAFEHPIDGNAEGSYLTMRSREGAIFFVINIVGNFGTVFLDNGYYNKAIAASPVHALPGYIIGGLSWFAIPWLTATTMGLTALSLESTPAFPTYPDRMSSADVSDGLVLPYAAVALLGRGGAVATLLIVFMAVTSATSSELIAVSSICTYDLYKTYFKPDASGKRLIWMSHCIVCLYALFISTFSVGLYYAGISMGYLYLMMGVIIGSAVLPATLTLVWGAQNKWAAALSPILGLAAALVAWLVTARNSCSSLDVECTGSNNPMLAGNGKPPILNTSQLHVLTSSLVVALLAPVVLIPVLTYALGPQHYDWKSMMEIRRGDDHDLADSAGVDLENTVGGHVETTAELEVEQAKLMRASKISKWATIIMTLAFLVLWPFPMYGSGYIFSKPFFTGWVTVGIIWIFCSLGAVGIFPVYEGRHTLIRTCKAIFMDITGKKGPKTIRAEHTAAVEHEIQAEKEKAAHGGADTPPSKEAPREAVITQ